MVVASPSVALAVMPTTVFTAAFSATLLTLALLSVGVVTSNSSTSLTLTVKDCWAVEPSAEVALTYSVRVAPASRSMLPATVTMPVTASISNSVPL